MRDHPQFSAYVALICVRFFWGTTYLGIRIALASFAPPALVALRYLVSGGVLLAGARGAQRVSDCGHRERRSKLRLTVGSFGTGRVVRHNVPVLDGGTGRADS